MSEVKKIKDCVDALELAKTKAEKILRERIADGEGISRGGAYKLLKNIYERICDANGIDDGMGDEMGFMIEGEAEGIAEDLYMEFFAD